MSRIRELKPPPKDRPVQFFFKNGTAGIYAANDRELVGVVAWCLPAQLDGTTSGPVHSLEAQELPAHEEVVEIRIRGHWYPGYWSDMRHQLPPIPAPRWHAIEPVDGSYMEVTGVDAWRPLPDDEPGDAELLEAVRAYVNAFSESYQSPGLRKLAELVEKRSSK